MPLKTYFFVAHLLIENVQLLIFFCCREIQCKAGKLLQKLEKSGQLDPKLKQCISNASSLDELESLAAPFKSASKQSLAAKAKSFQGQPTSIFNKKSTKKAALLLLTLIRTSLS